MEKKVKTYQSPVIESVEVKLQAMIAGSGCPSEVQQCTCNIGLGFGGGGCSDNGGGGRSREGSFDDED